MKFSKEMMRLYAVTDSRWVGDSTLLQQVQEAIDGGATMIQLREKEMDDAAFLELARSLAKLCRERQIPFIVNDRVEIAKLCVADGVHIGQNDMSAREARAILGSDAIIGVTAKTVESAIKAQADGASYLGSGAVFGTATKSDARPMSLQTLQAICSSVTIPVVAIGGINRCNIEELAGTGISGAAVVSGIFAAQDIRQECRILTAALQKILKK